MGHWVTGFCDRSGSFGLTMYKKEDKWHFKTVFEILLDAKDIHILEFIKDFFGVGTIYVTGNNATYRVADIKSLFIIIRHFVAYPLISPKLVVFNLWSEAVQLIANKQHFVPETFNYIMSIYAALGRGASKSVIKAFPSLTPIALPVYILPVNINIINPWWISGYLTLYCSFVLKIDTSGWGNSVYHKFRHIFNISFDTASVALAELLASYLGLSHYIRTDEARVDVMAQSAEEAYGLVLFMDNYPLQSYKNDKYLVWRDFVKKLQQERDWDIQRKLPYNEARYNKYNNLVNKFNLTHPDRS